MEFERFVEDIKNNNWNVFGVEVYENGELTHSFGDTNENLHPIYSATKTIVSIAVGILYDEGKIDLKRCILDYLPKEKVEKMSDEQKDAFSIITVERLLTMSVEGLPFVAEGDSFIDFALSCKLTDPKKRGFNYSNINTYLVCVALSEIIGGDLAEFIEYRIFKPLGIDRYEYGRCPEGYFYGSSRMKLSVNELSRIGLLLYNNGVYNDQRIVSDEYVKMATSVQQMNREGGYGYFVWKYKDGFSINGKLKQKCYVLPNRGIMITYLCHIEDDSCPLKESMEKWLLSE